MTLRGNRSFCIQRGASPIQDVGQSYRSEAHGIHQNIKMASVPAVKNRRGTINGNPSDGEKKVGGRDINSSKGILQDSY